MKRVAIIFDNQARPETTGFYCRRALGQLVDVEHFLPEEISTIPEGKFDLFLNIDDGMRYHLPDHLRPAACWVIDTHIDFSWSLEKANRFDFVFTAQRDGAERLQESGIESAAWLPLGCDPEIHQSFQTEKQFDVSFVGNVLGRERQELLTKIASRYPQHFIGQKYFQEMAECYSASRVVFNRSVRNDINMRVFEALGCGAFLMTNDLEENGQDELLRDGIHLVTYRSSEELFDKLEFYLQRESLRSQIALQGHQQVLAQHTYFRRMQQLLQSVQEHNRARYGLGTSENSSSPHTVSRSSSQNYPGIPLPHKSVSACLLSWQRPDNIAQIVAHLRQYPIIDDILVWNNNPEIALEVELEGVEVISSDRNWITYGRFLCAERAKHSIIYTQDDDCLVQNINGLYESFLADPVGISHGLKPGHLLQNAENIYGSAQMALLGWGSFFRKEWLRIFDKYIQEYGIDQLLIRKADRIFSLLLNRRHRSQLAMVTDLEGASGHEALSVRDDHEQMSHRAIQRVLSLLQQEIKDDSTPRFTSQTMLPAVDVESPVQQNQSYFEFSRPEVVSLVPQTAVRVLDLGCGAGRLGEAIKLRQQALITGVELNREAASVAATRLDDVRLNDIEQLQGEFSENQFDAVVCADVLEHLRSPEKTLQQIRSWLQPGGSLIASIPNIRNHTVLTGLIDGNWTYESAGLLDQTHYRFFTRREIEKLFFRAGFEIEELQIVPGPGYQDWSKRGDLSAVKIGNLHISGLAPADAEEFYAYQYLVHAKPTRQANYGLTSIIIVTHNELAYTQQCLDSIGMRTDEPYELILVDNASTDKTVEYLKSFPNAHLIENSKNRGFPAAVNQGIRVANGDNILLLNNDTLVTTGWLQKLLRRLHSSPQIGIVGPVSNNVSGPQQIPVTYSDFSSLDGFAWEWGKQHSGCSVDERRLVGFCFLFKQELVERIGLLDERFGIGCFEDDDYCRRAREAGYQTLIAQDSFVHHFGSRTFLGSGVDFGNILHENEQKYREKWQKPTASKRFEQKAEQPISQSQNQKSKRLSLCMIVRDNEETIEPCLKSIQPWVDEMVIVDTGSIDRTPEICKKYGARVYEFPWCDDFSTARNESLKYAEGEWLFWMDSDDTIEAECGRKLRELADSSHPENIYGYIMQVHCPGPPGDSSMTAVDHVKMFRNLPELRFEHRIHEQIIPAIRRAGGEVTWTDIFVVHSGSDHSAEGRARKLQRDYRLLELDLLERPDHPFVLFNLGMTYADDQKYSEAIKYLKRCLQVSAPGESQVRKAYALLINALAQNDESDEAWEYSVQSLQLFPDDKELLFRQAMLHHHFGRLQAAKETYKRVIHEESERHFTSIDVGLSGYKARHNLAIVYDELREYAEAENQWREIIKEEPNYKTAWKSLGETLLKADRLDDLQRLIQRMCAMELTQVDAEILRARLYEQTGEYHCAIDLLKQLEQDYPLSEEPLTELCRLMFEHSYPAEALKVLKRLTVKNPEDAAACHNLGTVYLQLEQPEKAIAAYRQSLKYRTTSAETWHLLGHAYQNSDKPTEALQAWKETIRFSPDHQEASLLIRQYEEQTFEN